MDTNTAIRKIRAELATLFEPDHPHLREYVNLHGPTDAHHKIINGVTGVAGLRAEPVGRDVLADAARCGLRIHIPEDPGWPARLTGPDKPLCLWVRGDLPDLHRSVTITGCRAATHYGQYIAAEFGYALATCGWTVINAGGYGIDTAALTGAVQAAVAPVLATQPCGLDRPHPSTTSTLTTATTVISMWPPGAAPSRHRIETNGRLLAALTAATVLVEASARSQTLSILRRALQLSRTAMVVPGPVTSATSVGANNAARNLPGVRIVTTADQIHTDLTTAGNS